jgi:protoporphyrinogen oxidase
MTGAKTFGVIGGGILGIDIARRLNDAGYKVTILESAPEVGGLTVSSKYGDYIWDKFYHVILPDDRSTIRMVAELGLSDKLTWKTTRTGFFSEGKYYSLSDLGEFIRFPGLNFIDKFRLGLTIMAGTCLSNYKRLETIPVTTWLKRWSGQRTFLKIWFPLLKAKLGDGYKFASAAFICSTIKRLYGARKSHARKEMFGYVKGGYAVILGRIQKKLREEGINLTANYKVRSIEVAGSGKINVVSQEGSVITYDYVVSTLPCSLTASICPSLTALELSKLRNIKYLGVVCVSLLLKKALTPYYVTNITDTRIPFTGVIEMTALVDHATFGGNSLVYLPKYLDPDDQMFSKSDEEITRDFIGFLKMMQPLLEEGDILSSKVAKARYVIALPVLEYSAKLPSLATSVNHFFIMNSSFITDGTLNVNETLMISERYTTKLINTIKNEIQTPCQCITGS